MSRIFENHWQARKVRVVLWVSLLACAGACYGGWTIYQTFGLAPADGGVLRPAEERLLLATFVAALGIAFALGMMLFASLYVLRLDRSGDRVVIETMTPLGLGRWRHHLPFSKLGAGAYYHGRLRTWRGHDVNAPWITLPAGGRWLPFLIDLQAETIDQDALAAILRGAVADWRSDSE